MEPGRPGVARLLQDIRSVKGIIKGIIYNRMYPLARSAHIAESPLCPFTMQHLGYIWVTFL